MAVFEITSPKGNKYQVEHPGDPTQDEIDEMMAELQASESDTGEGTIESTAAAIPRGFVQSIGSRIEGVGDILGSGTEDNILQEYGRATKDMADRQFSVNPSREDEFLVQAGGVVGQAVSQAAELAVPVAKFGAASKMTSAVGLGSGAIQGADAGEDVADQFGVNDDPLKRAALMATFGGAEVIAEKLGGFGAESALGKFLMGDAKEGLKAYGKAVIPEAFEEGGTQLAQNAATIGIVGAEDAAAAGVPLPGYTEGALNAAALGTVGGVFMAAPLLIPRSTKVNTASVADAEAAGDTEAAEILRQVGADVRMMPVPPPSVADMKAGEDNLKDLLPEPAAADFTPPTTDELPPVIEGLQPEPTGTTVEFDQIEQQGKFLVPPTTDQEKARMVDEGITPGAPAAETPLPTKQEMEQRAFERSIIDTQGRISEPAAVQAFNALNKLIGGTVKLVVNDSGTSNPNDRVGLRGSHYKGTVYLNRRLMRADTPVHELGHVFIPTLRESNPQLFAQGQALIEGAAKPLADAIRARYERRGKTMTPEAFEHEVLTTLYGNETAQEWQKYVRDPGMVQQIKQWIAQMREWVAGLLQSKGVDPNMSMSDYAKKLNRQVLAGKVKAPESPVAGREESYAGQISDMDEGRKNQLITAKFMQQQGRDPEAIRKITGWFPGKYDGKMRYEVSDQDVKMKTPIDETFYPFLQAKVNQGNPVLLGEVIDHPALFKAYPSFQAIKVEPLRPQDADTSNFTTNAHWDGYSNTIRVKPGRTEGVLSSIMHEVQHAIQDAEDFARGASPEVFRDNADAWNRAFADNEEEQSILADAMSIRIDRDQLMRTREEPPDGVELRERFEKGADDATGWGRPPIMGAVAMARRYALEQLRQKSDEAAARLEAKRAEMGNAAGANKVDQYMRVPGEIEARDVQARLPMSERQRDINAPYSSENIPVEKAVTTDMYNRSLMPNYSLAEPMEGTDRFAAMLARADAKRAAESGGKAFRIDGVQKGFASDSPDADYVPMFQNVTITDPTHPAVGSTLSIPLEGRPAPLSDDVIQDAVDAKRDQQFSLDDDDMDAVEDGDDIRYSLDDGTKQSGVAKNQPLTRMRAVAQHHIYNGETGEQALDEALGIFLEEENAPFKDRLATFNRLVADRGTKYANMTPGAYFGLVAEEQTSIENSPTSTEAEKAQATKNLNALMSVVATVAAGGGQFIKGFDFGLRLANNPRIQVDKAEELAPFRGEQKLRDEFDKEMAAVTKALDEEVIDEITDLDEGTIEDLLNKSAVDVVKGDEASDAGAAELEAIVAPDADAAAAEDTPERKSWAGKLMDKVRKGAAKLAARWMVVMRAINVLNRKGDSSLSEDEIDANVKKLLKEMEDAGLTKEQQLKKLRGEAFSLQKQISEDKDLQTLTNERLQKNLNRLLNGKGKKTPQTAGKAIASAITAAVMAKAGYAKAPVQGDMALAIGLLIANQGIAAESIQNAHTLLEADETTEGMISREKLKAFMQLAVAKQFDQMAGADNDSAPFGEAQVASVLRAEMKKLDISMTAAVQNAAMERQTAAQLEAQLRDPKRNLEKILGKENLDNMVSVVLAEYNKTATERTAALRKRADQMESDRAVSEAARDSRRKRARTKREEIRRLTKELAQANEETRQELSAAAKESKQKRAMQIRMVLKQKRKELSEDRKETRKAIRGAETDAKEKKRRFLRNRKRARMAARRTARKDGTAQPRLEYDELQDLMAQKDDTIIGYLARNFGFDLKGLTKLVREADREAGVEALTLKLADELGLTKEQAQKVMQPIIAAAMKKISGARAKQVENKINQAIKTATNRQAGIKKGGQKTEAERLLDLAKLGGLTAENIEKVMLNNLNAKQFTPEYRKALEDLLAKANDPNISQESRDVYTAMFLNAIRSAQGVSAIGLLGEWTMSNIFLAVLSTLKVNAFWGFAKATVDNAVYGFYSGPKELMDAAKEAGVNPPKGVRKAYLKQWLRGYTAQMQWNAKYMMAEGRAKDESDYTVQFSNSIFELLAHNPETAITWTRDGKPLPKMADSLARRMAASGKWTRRSMVATDLVNRVSAYEMLKMTAVTKAMIEGGQDLSGQPLADHIDTALYGMPLKDALAKANRDVDAEIATGATRPEEREIRIGGLLDEQMGKAIGLSGDIIMSEQERMLAQDSARRGAGRRTVANQTEGAYGVLSGLLMDGTRRLPGLRFLLPAIRMPIGAFSQALDWSPVGFARYKAISWNQGKSASLTNAIFNRDGLLPWWNLPEGGVTEDMANDLWAKALVGTTLMVGMLIKIGMDLDEDEDDADFYLTGMGPTDPAQKKLWKEKGYTPFMGRLFGVTFNYQESPMYPIFAVAGAWSDANRYGKPGEADSAKIAFAMTKIVSGFKDAVVLRNLADVIGTGSAYSDESKVKQTVNSITRLGSTIIAPRIGAEINQALFGKLDDEHWQARLFANIPFVPRMFNRPALDFFGREIHAQKGDTMGEILPMVRHRISPTLVDDEKLAFAYRMGANTISAGRRKKKDGSLVEDDFDLVRQWHINAGKATEKWMTPARIKYFDKAMGKDPEAARKEFDAELLDIRNNELMKFKDVVFN